MRILNLYAGIGGNRKLWGEEHEITAIEINPKIAKTYQDHFPKDNVIVADAHQYLLEHYKEFDFIWSSPPCQTHSITNWFLNGAGVIRYPDMSLWQEILFLQQFCKCKWVVENVKSYYQPLIKPQIAGRHYFWSNFHITNLRLNTIDIGTCNRSASIIAQKRYKQKIEERNMVNPRLGLHILKCAFKVTQNVLKT